MMLLQKGQAERLRALAARTDQTIEDCLAEAIEEYITTREDFAAAMADLDDAEQRVLLRVANE